MKNLVALFGWSFLYLIPAVVITTIVRLFARRYNKLEKWEYGSIFLPYLVWFAAISIKGTGKSFANLSELFIIGIAYGVFQIIRAFYPKKAIIFSLIIPVLFTILVYIFMPALRYQNERELYYIGGAVIEIPQAISSQERLI